MKNKRFLFRMSIYIAVVLFLAGCIEIIEFDTSEDDKKLAVQGYITNHSALDYQSFPMEADFFTVKLSWTHRVTNELDERVSEAQILLKNQFDDEWFYYEYALGEYRLIHNEFKAIEGEEYQIEITLEDGQKFESMPQSLVVGPEIGEVSFYENTKQEYIKVNEESILMDVNGAEVSISIPPIEGEKEFLRWEIVPSWIYVAPNSGDSCWITNPNYLYDIHLKEEKVGNNEQLLFFLPTRNIRIQHDFTALIRQYSMSEELFRFWEDLKAQGQRGSIFDAPPYNISTNIYPVNTETEAVGYFQVLHEQITRWNFNHTDLSYHVSFDKPCEPIPGAPFIPPPDCYNCMSHKAGGTNTNIKPYWWQ